jgi:hypothetical protein
MSGVRDPRYQPGPQQDVAKAPRPWRQRRYRVAAAVCGVLALGSTAFLVQHGVSDGRAMPGGGSRPWPADSLDGRGPGLGLGMGGQASAGAPGAPGAPRRTAGATGGSRPKASKAAPKKPGDSPTTATVDINGIPATVTTSGSMPLLHHTMRVVSARANLSGQRELAWAADSGHRVGSVSCTQNFRFNPTSSARVRPTLLLCWHVSATRTVYTVAVDIDRRPSEQDSVAIVNQVWASLG